MTAVDVGQLSQRRYAPPSNLSINSASNSPAQRLSPAHHNATTNGTHQNGGGITLAATHLNSNNANDVVYTPRSNGNHQYTDFNHALYNKQPYEPPSKPESSILQQQSSNSQQPSGSVEADQHQHQPIWQVWNGKNRFWCSGRIMTGPDLRNLLTTVLLITVPVGLFLWSPAWDLTEAGKYNRPGAAGSWAFIVGLCLYVLSMIFLARCALVDPGIIPPNTADDSVGRFRPNAQEIVVNGMPTQLKYCNTCNIHRPPRAVHCSICNQCMDTFDHHCPWLGTCVARHNYRMFTFFVYTLTALTFFVFATCIYHMVYLTGIYQSNYGYNGWSAFGAILARNPLSLILACYCTIAMFFVVGLCGFHLFLVTKGQTTNEQLKGSYAFTGGSPFSQGFLHNVANVICTVPKSHLDVQQDYEPGQGASRHRAGKHVTLQPMNAKEVELMAQRAQNNPRVASQTRRDSLPSNNAVSSTSNHHRLNSMEQHHTRQPSLVNTAVDELGNNVYIPQQTPRDVNSNKMASSPHSYSPNRRSRAIDAAGLAVLPVEEARTGRHTRGPSLSIVVPDVVETKELEGRSAIQSPLTERAPTLSQVTVATPMAGNYSHDGVMRSARTSHDMDRDNAAAERSVFQSPLLSSQHHRQSSAGILDQYIPLGESANPSPHHHRRASSSIRPITNSSTPNRRASVSSGRQSLTPVGEARASFQSPEGLAPVLRQSQTPPLNLNE